MWQQALFLSIGNPRWHDRVSPRPQSLPKDSSGGAAHCLADDPKHDRLCPRPSARQTAQPDSHAAFANIEALRADLSADRDCRIRLPVSLKFLAKPLSRTTRRERRPRRHDRRHRRRARSGARGPQCNRTVTTHGVGLAAAQDAGPSRVSTSFDEICGCCKLIMRKIGTCGDPEANLVSSHIGHT